MKEQCEGERQAEHLFETLLHPAFEIDGNSRSEEVYRTLRAGHIFANAFQLAFRPYPSPFFSVVNFGDSESAIGPQTLLGADSPGRNAAACVCTPPPESVQCALAHRPDHDTYARTPFLP